jgi:hydroxyacylglutathione hydrolase
VKALVVDPCRDISFILDVAKKEGAKIIGVYLSHSHADFVAGHMELVNALKCPIYQSHKSGAEYPFKPVQEGSEIRVGKALVKFLETPGHTPDGMCALVYGPDNAHVPELMFTGDVLFVGSVGRPDLMGGTASAAWLASAFFDSWQNKISKLDDGVKIFPAHGAGSLCGAHLADKPFSTLGEEKKPRIPI